MIILIMLGFLYLIMRQNKQPKSKEQKQAEILRAYEKQMKRELLGLDEQEYKKRKMQLLKKFADELNRNLFFDEQETRNFIQKLINTQSKPN